MADRYNNISGAQYVEPVDRSDKSAINPTSTSGPHVTLPSYKAFNQYV